MMMMIRMFHLHISIILIIRQRFLIDILSGITPSSQAKTSADVLSNKVSLLPNDKRLLSLHRLGSCIWACKCGVCNPQKQHFLFRVPWIPSSSKQCVKHTSATPWVEKHKFRESAAPLSSLWEKERAFPEALLGWHPEKFCSAFSNHHHRKYHHEQLLWEEVEEDKTRCHSNIQSYCRDPQKGNGC